MVRSGMTKRKGYGQFCPVAKAAEIVAERWTMLVIREVAMGSHRFGEIQKGVPRMSRTLLSKRLTQLHDSGIILRSQIDTGPVYHLTEAGEALKPIIVALGFWGHRHVQHSLHSDDLDPSLLMWDIRRSVDHTAFGQHRRQVTQFDLSGVPAGRRRPCSTNRPRPTLR